MIDDPDKPRTFILTINIIGLTIKAGISKRPHFPSGQLRQCGCGQRAALPLKQEELFITKWLWHTSTFWPLIAIRTNGTQVGQVSVSGYLLWWWASCVARTPLDFEDVHDLVEIFVKAQSVPNAAGKRFSLNATSIPFIEFEEILHQHFSECSYCIPNRIHPDSLDRLLAIFITIARAVAG